MAGAIIYYSAGSARIVIFRDTNNILWYKKLYIKIIYQYVLSAIFTADSLREKFNNGDILRSRSTEMFRAKGNRETSAFSVLRKLAQAISAICEMYAVSRVYFRRCNVRWGWEIAFSDRATIYQLNESLFNAHTRTSARAARRGGMARGDRSIHVRGFPSLSCTRAGKR